MAIIFHYDVRYLLPPIATYNFPHNFQPIFPVAATEHVYFYFILFLEPHFSNNKCTCLCWYNNFMQMLILIGSEVYYLMII